MSDVDDDLHVDNIHQHVDNLFDVDHHDDFDHVSNLHNHYVDDVSELSKFDNHLHNDGGNGLCAHLQQRWDAFGAGHPGQYLRAGRWR